MGLKGHKQTEVGVIPQDWDAGCLGRFWDVIDCKHVTARFIASGFPVASINEVHGRFVDLANAKHTTEKFYTLLIEGGRKPKVGDLILSRNATVGEVAQVPIGHPPFAMGQDVCLLRKKSPGFSTDYLQAVLRSPVVANQLSDLMVGSTFKRANIEQIRNFSVPMAPPPEQDAIARALSKADDLIESLEQLIAKKRHIKEGAMHELLTGKKRLAGFSGQWGLKPLGEGVRLISGQHVLARHCNIDGHGIPYVTGPADFPEGVIQHTKFTTKPGTICRLGDVLVTVKGSGAGTLVLASADYCISRQLMAVRATEWNANYVYFSLMQDASRFNAAATGLIPGLSRNDILTKAISLPPTKTEQAAIAAVLSDMDAEIAALEFKVEKARQIKQGMMQNLLTGRIRLV